MASDIGSQALRILLEQDHELRVVVRDPAKLTAEVRDRVDVVTGSTATQRRSTEPPAACRPRSG